MKRTTTRHAFVMVDQEPSDLGALLVNPKPKSNTVRRSPCEDRALFQEFASLDATNVDSLLAFSNEHGMLGFGTPVYCELTRPADALRCSESRDPITGETVGYLQAETHADWTHAIAKMRVAVSVLRAINAPGQAGEEKELTKLFSWQSIDVDQRYPDDRPGHWMVDTHPSLPIPNIKEFNREATDRIWGYVTHDILSEFETIQTVSKVWIADEINRHLNGKASPKIKLEGGGRIREYLQCSTLLAAMWSQVYSAFTGGKRYEQCKGCGKWFEVSNERGGRTVRAMYCGDACRVRSYRARRDQAATLAGEGLSAKEIVERFQSEGHEADLATVKKWVKPSTKRKGK
ncbi:hypothetical protein [Gemmata massiliana]|uniref:hypothetical protein n=1 Tax=Gemmata massiliana TaxID=1210884 RepID=UPI0013A6FC5A|nr:hypothetical protein [Gemmata massiliana]